MLLNVYCRGWLDRAGHCLRVVVLDATRTAVVKRRAHHKFGGLTIRDKRLLHIISLCLWWCIADFIRGHGFIVAERNIVPFVLLQEAEVTLVFGDVDIRKQLRLGRVHLCIGLILRRGSLDHVWEKLTLLLAA